MSGRSRRVTPPSSPGGPYQIPFSPLPASSPTHSISGHESQCSDEEVESSISHERELCPRSPLTHCNLGVSQETLYSALDTLQGGQRTLSARSSVSPPPTPLYTPIPIDPHNSGSISDCMADSEQVEPEWVQSTLDRALWQESQDRRFFAQTPEVSTQEACPAFAHWYAQKLAAEKELDFAHVPESFTPDVQPHISSPMTSRMCTPHTPRKHGHRLSASRARQIAFQLSQELATLEKVQARLRRKYQRMLRLAAGIH